MKKVFLLFMSVATLMSCSDDGIEPKKSENDECKISKIEENENGGQMNFSFDQQGNVTKIVDNMNTDYVTDNIQIDLTYTKDKITVKETYNGDEEWKTEYFIDNNKVTYRLNYYENSQSSRTNYQYNADGYLVKITSGVNNVNTTNIEYSNGNITLLKSNYNDSQEFAVTYNSNPRLAYSEYLSSPYSEWFLFEAGEAILYEKGLLGKKSKNQITSVKQKNNDTETMSYGSDSNGKTNSITSNTSWRNRTCKFTFDCQ